MLDLVLEMVDLFEREVNEERDKEYFAEYLNLAAVGKSFNRDLGALIDRILKLHLPGLESSCPLLQPIMRPTIRHKFWSNTPQAWRQPWFVCRNCREQASPTSLSSTSSTSSKRHASSSNDDNKISFAEKLRRKIWASDVPPGQKDPYARLSPEERDKEIQERAELAEKISRRNQKLRQKSQTTDEATQEASTMKRREAAALEKSVGSGISNAETASQGSNPYNLEKYSEAVTWDGLDQIGGAEGWWEEAWDKENQFKGYVECRNT